MKRFFSFFAACLAFTGMMAQTSVVVTLTHEGQTTEYYGQNGFVNAIAASTDGDLITLSGGHFNGTTINKSLNIRGNGVDGENATIIDTRVILEKSENETNRFLNIEGISFTDNVNIQTTKDNTTPNIIENVTIKKCDLKNFSSQESYLGNGYYHGTTKNLNFIQCRITNSSIIYNKSEVSYINCIVKGHLYSTDALESNPKINAINSVMLYNGNGKIVSCIHAKNSIFLLNVDSFYSTNHIIPSSSSMENCIVTGFVGDATRANEIFANCTNSNSGWINIENVFANLASYNYKNFTTSEDYTLKESVEINGTDGKECGIFGGDNPYSNIVSYPYFTTFEVAEKVVNGKLEVNIATE